MEPNGGASIREVHALIDTVMNEIGELRRDVSRGFATVRSDLAVTMTRVDAHTSAYGHSGALNEIAAVKDRVNRWGGGLAVLIPLVNFAAVVVLRALS